MRVRPFVDTHFHLSWTARSLLELNLKECSTVECVLSKVREESERGGTYGGWVIGSLLHYKLAKAITKELLDEVSDKPVSIATRDGHMAVVNSKAIEISGVDCSYSGVECVEGVPTGRLYEDAMLLVRRKMPDPPIGKLVGAYKAVLDDLYSNGFLQIHAMTSRWLEWELVKSLNHKVHVIPYMRKEAFVKGSPGIKLFADGVLIYGTALMNGKGRKLIDERELSQWLIRGKEEGFRVAVHAMGDEAIDLVIRAYEMAGKPKRVLRIEHAAITRDDQLEYLASEGIEVSVQPGIMESVGVEEFKSILGPNWKRFMRVRDMIELGVKVYHGSDSPVGPWRLKEVFKYYKLLPKPVDDLETVLKLMSSGWEIHGERPSGELEVTDDLEVRVL
ncbi:hypothetical protein EYM_05665 [Ignicoccus islandicus DSM 13165]|uniref:Amidohydrolase 3 domain-containing protein n=1 Tax=Ignicoccus islandicus DSM 13165 TaxID=940295 RepID=A0A0U3FT35_9CREN|nr:amidohydrolase family protein [Ignicoccus islandicus]ALU12608.1 hypothetical protein EYM_05665 [Ignicoccus islandicus DSM 13165]